MTRGKTPWTLIAAVAVCALAVACAASTLEPEDATAATEEADSTPAVETHKMDVEMEYTEEQKEEPKRDRTPPPTRTYSPMNKMD
jgi:hypothetical protein